MRTRSKAHSLPICRVTGKQRLRERQEVGLALRAAKLRRETAAAEGRDHSWQAVRGYKCEHCGGYHLTSRPTWVDRSNSVVGA
jgi:hypothetical protein